MKTYIFFVKTFTILVFLIISIPSKAQENVNTVKVIDSFNRENHSGEAIIIQRHRDDLEADEWVREYIKRTKNKLNALKQTESSGCSNLDFEDGDFNNWTGQTGVNNGYPAGSWTNGIVAGRYTIVSGGTDPYGGFPMLAPNGGSFSVQLGNSNTNYEAEQLIYTFTVQPQDTNFIYKYAIVLEDPGHTAMEQPYFEFKIIDNSGFDTIPCSYKLYAAGDSILGFQTNGSVRYKPWAMVGINLSSYVGQNVTVMVTTADCAQGGHFGYGYIDFLCPASMLQTPNIFCEHDTSVVLYAPHFESGFDFNWSTGQTGPSITINPQLYNGSSIECYIESPNSAGICGFWYVFPIQVIQINSTVSVSDNIITSNSTEGTYQWVDCNNGYSPIIGEVNQSFTASNYGNYAVIVSAGSCSDTSECINITNIKINKNTSRETFIYPNPVHNKLIIEAPPEIETYVSITDLQGRTFFESAKISSSPFSINTSLFETGMYFLKISDKNNTSVYKIIKE